jgi:pimeloyl-ACP methyl ester carboxylesterase
VSENHLPIDAPSRWLRISESRAVLEFAAFVAALPALRMVGRGDRHPVLVLPGFTATDKSTAPLRRVLRAQGYWVHGWGLGTNLGPTDRVLDGLHDRLLELHERHQRPVTLVGWSLGGNYARELARSNPEAVRQVITLGSPFRITPSDRSAASPLFEQLQGGFSARVKALFTGEHTKAPITVPTTAIYSRSDGVVRWHLCIDVESDRHENIEVRGSHSGLGWNPAVIYAVSDRLSQLEGTWRRFRAPLPIRHLYPRPASWAEQHVAADPALFEAAPTG